jgi:hypothetical protein
MTGIKTWGKDPFWGLGYEFDPQWLLTDEQRKLQKTLIDLCQQSMRENAVESDKKLIYPRKNFQTLAKHGFLGLIVPKELGGLGQNHMAAAMAVETIARYGCPSTAMCYTMHLGAVAAALLRHHDNAALKDILSRLDDLGRLRRLVYRADHQPGFRRQLCQPLLLPHPRQRGGGRSGELGRPRPARQSIRPAGGQQQDHPGQSPGRPDQ